MEIKVENNESQRQPLLETPPPPLPLSDSQPPVPKTPAQKAIRKTFKGTAHLAKLLPTGTVLVFQFLSPVLTNQGQCRTVVSQTATLAFLALCCLSCFLLCLTDSFRDPKGKVRYGLATTHGLWVIDGSVTLAPDVAEKYKLCFIDFFHGIVSMMVFVAVAMFDKNVVKCLYPSPSDDAEDILTTLPIGIGVISSVLFVVFPSKRHGIGFPLSPLSTK